MGKLKRLKSTVSPAGPDCADLKLRAVEAIQRAKMVLDVSSLDLSASEERLGPFHPTTIHFREAWNEARRDWDVLRARLGRAVVDEALEEPTATALSLDSPAGSVVLIAILGETYRVRRLPNSSEAPHLFRLDKWTVVDDVPRFVARLADGSLVCDCAGWTFQDDPPRPCKHLRALLAMGWVDDPPVDEPAAEQVSVPGTEESS